MKLSPRIAPWLIVLLAALAFVPGLGRVHLFDWDEINFAESAREMLVSGEWGYVQINFEPFWEKPPLFIWMQALAMQALGVGEVAARLPNALGGILTLLTLYFIGRREGGHHLGLFWTLAYGCSILPHLYFKSGIIDPWFNYFIFLGLYFAYRFLQAEEKALLWLVCSAASVGGSMLTKGPVGPLIFGLSGLVFLLWRRSYWRKVQVKPVLLFGLVFGLVGGAWFLWQILDGRWEVVEDFLVYQVRLLQTEDAGHRGFLGYHAVVLLLGVFPASPLALGQLRRRPAALSGEADWTRLMQATFWVVLILFSLVQTKIVHYSSMAYFPLTYLAARELDQLAHGKARLKGWQVGLLLGIGLLLSLLLLALAWAPELQAWLRDAAWLKDPFARGNLQAEVGWGGHEWLPALPLLAGLGALLRYRRQQPLRGLLLLWMGTGLFTGFTLLWVLPRVEPISQGAAVAFFEEKADQEAYLGTLFYKSYAPYFYGRVQPPAPGEPRSLYEKLHSPVNQPVYIVSKVQHRARIAREYPQLRLLYERNGFLFYRRDLPSDDSE